MICMPPAPPAKTRPVGKRKKPEPEKAPASKSTGKAAGKASGDKFADQLKTQARDSKSIEKLLLENKAGHVQINKLREELDRSKAKVQQQEQEFHIMAAEKEKLAQQLHNMKEAGKYLELPILDHLIITSEGYYSFADEGMLQTY